MKVLLFLIGVIYFIASNEAGSLAKDEQRFTLRGRVVFNGSRIPIECDGKLIVELVDTSRADGPARAIGQSFGKAIRFPMAFAIKYSSKQVSGSGLYSVNAYVRHQNGRLLYISDSNNRVTLTGLERTKLVDVPVSLVRKILPGFNRRQWPELLGKDGEEAVKIIKEQTGFTNVKTYTEGSPLTKDYRSNRVRIITNNKGIVVNVPSIA